MSTTEDTPDYLPARMLNEFTYCPRLFYYEWVDSVFVNNRETVEGSLRHAKLDSKTDALPSSSEVEAAGGPIHSRSVTLSSDTHRLIAKMDLIEGDGEVVVPVDYKRGAPRKLPDGSIEAWDTDRIQTAVHALVIRDNGYICEEGVIYYVKTRQRVRIEINDSLISETLDTLERAFNIAAGDRIPKPLVDSPKCPRCSLVGICLPDETAACDSSDSPLPNVQPTLFDIGPSPDARSEFARSEDKEVRRLVPARDDLRPLYLNTQGYYVGKSGNVLKIKEKTKVVKEVRMNEICQVNVFGNVQISTQATQQLCKHEIPIAWFSQGGWFYGLTQGLGLKNIFLRREQFRWADAPSFCLRLARALVSGKIRNQRTMLQRNHVEPPRTALAQMKCMREDAERARSLEQLLGIEGNAARLYFQNFSGMIKVDQGDPASSNERDNGRFTFDFTTRNRRPPRDAVNALLSLSYSMLAKDVHIACHTVGFDPYLGFYHQPRFGRAALALDLMEPFRPLIADSAVLSAINTRMVTSNDFVQAGDSVSLRPSGRTSFYRAYEQRMDALVTHPLFGYRVNYRRIIEIQARLLARVVSGELTTYQVFTTR